MSSILIGLFKFISIIHNLLRWSTIGNALPIGHKLLAINLICLRSLFIKQCLISYTKDDFFLKRKSFFLKKKVFYPANKNDIINDIKRKDESYIQMFF